MSEGIFRSDKFPRQVGVFASLRQVPSLEGIPRHFVPTIDINVIILIFNGKAIATASE